MQTSLRYSPWDQLPAGVPKNETYPVDHFYEHTAKHCIKDAVRIMNNGLHIDLSKVATLEEKLSAGLEDVANKLSTHPYVVKYLEIRNKDTTAKYIEERTSKLKPMDVFIKPFSHKNVVHRSYFMKIYLEERNIQAVPKEEVADGVPKWTVNLIKKLAPSHPLLTKLLAGKVTATNPIAIKAMNLLAEHKQAIYNSKYLAQINDPPKIVEGINLNSPKQKRELFEMLKIPSDKVSKTTGLASYDKEEIERINKETTDPKLKELTELLLEHSAANIIAANFVPAFYKYTVDSRLHGQYKLLGAKSG